mgnify:CR=1 FL=1
MRIRIVRKQLGLTLEELSEISGLSTTHINDIELGKTGFTIEVAKKICDALKVSLIDVLKDIPEISFDSSVSIPNIDVWIKSMPKIINYLSALQQFFQDLLGSE